MDITSLLLRFFIETGFLLFALWLMVKIQKFQYTFLGLLGSAAVASALDIIPIFGRFLALPVLYACLLKVTREDYTGVVFTSAISYALVFGMNLFLLGSIIGGLKVSAKELPEKTAISTVDNQDDDEDQPSNRGRNGASATSNSTASSVGKSADVPAPIDVTQGLVLKGVMKGVRSCTAMISSSGKTYSLDLGSTITMETAAGKVPVTLEKATESSVILNISGEKVELNR